MVRGDYVPATATISTPLAKTRDELQAPEWLEKKECLHENCVWAVEKKRKLNAGMEHLPLELDQAVLEENRVVWRPVMNMDLLRKALEVAAELCNTLMWLKRGHFHAT